MGLDTYIRFAVALAVVLGLIAGITWLIRRFGWSGRISPGSSTPANRRRLSVTESCNIDGKRRIVLVKRDGVEHLILLTSNGSGVIVERGIAPAKRFRDTMARNRQAGHDEDDEAAEAEAADTVRPQAAQRRRM